VAKKRRKLDEDGKPKRQNPIPVRFGKADMDDYDELYRRFESSDIRNISTFIKHLLSQVLNPDPTSETAVRELLRELREVTYTVRDGVEKLDTRTKGLRGTVAKGIVALLVETADMLSIKVIKVGSEAYYLDLAREDYYFNGGEPPGQWMGSGCRFLNLAGTVERQAFSRLFNGFHPNANTGPPESPVAKSLVQNAGDKDRRAGFDLTFNAPKSVSVIWSQSSPAMQKRIEELHNQAIADTLRFMEQTMAYSRTGKAGSGEAVPVKLIAANFRHGTSRAQDPHLHSHLLVMNVAVDATDIDKTRSIEPKPIFKNKMLLGAIYRSRTKNSDSMPSGKAIRLRFKASPTKSFSTTPLDESKCSLA
jgi:conjugative relaxase-like TrwC/TraI family protein